MKEQALIDFETEIATLYNQGKIRAPVHLSSGNESALTSLFYTYVSPESWVFSTWRSHYHALLHGVPRAVLREKILQGESISIIYPERRFYASGLVGGMIPVALGTAMAIKRLRGREAEFAHPEDAAVWCFVGDMAAETGAFAEAVKYAERHKLPVVYVIEDNALSINTPTGVAWGGEAVDLTVHNKLEQVSSNCIKYSYRLNGPHSGTGTWVSF
jgi:TPP-dependent pyruvate/acetoin dehydrogenase alpha subunit